MDDEKDLREWMQTTYGGLRDDRSTASYALEALKTERHNRMLHAAKANLTMAVEQLTQVHDWIARSLDDIRRLS